MLILTLITINFLIIIKEVVGQSPDPIENENLTMGDYNFASYVQIGSEFLIIREEDPMIEDTTVYALDGASCLEKEQLEGHTFSYESGETESGSFSFSEQDRQVTWTAISDDGKEEGDTVPYAVWDNKIWIYHFSSK